MPTAAEYHEWVANYNWDDPLTPIWALVDREETEFATALLIYWRLEGPLFESGDEQEEVTRLHNTVEQRLLSGFYRNRTIEYYPIEAERLTKVTVYKLRKAGVAEELFAPQYPATKQEDQNTNS